MHLKRLITTGRSIDKARKALIMVHGRGGMAEDILSLAAHLDVKDFALIAPQATNNTWYPYSFMAPQNANEPWLSSALQVLRDVVDDLVAANILKENIFFIGFSQGACLVLEFIARNANKYGGVIALTGGLIGDEIQSEHYAGHFHGMPIFLGSSDPDPHVPVSRVIESEKILVSMGASVVKKIYPGMGHTINEDELRFANEVFCVK